MKERAELPFKSLGQRLKSIRQKLHESLADVSGAVEIDEKTLERIELGSERPSEDILLLLITHFGMQDDEAASLWQLAGYDPPQHDHDREHDHDMLNNDRNLVLVMAVDPRIMYSDGVQVQVTPSGVVLQFTQGAGTRRQLTTARVGMSREQAEHVASALQQALASSSPVQRQLPTGPTQNNAKQDSAAPSGDTKDQPQG
jgi:transcriptional regulator with XRE-family HTH domain